MKYFLVLLSGLLAEKCFAHRCKAGSKVDIFLLYDPYQRATECTRVPSGGYNVIITNFKKQYIANALTYGQTLVNFTYDWGLERGDDLINAAEKRSCTLKKCIKSKKDSNDVPTCLEYTLEDLTKQFHFFLELMPGKAVLKHQPLPDLPPLPGKIQPIPELSTTDVFLHLAEAFNNDLEDFYNLVTNIHQAGWRVLRTYLETLQMQFRSEILNDQVLPEYRSIARKVLKFAKCIQHDVKPELWESFESSCELIIRISDDYKKSKCTV